MSSWHRFDEGRRQCARAELDRLAALSLSPDVQETLARLRSIKH
jgi:hypothetical protein